MIEIRFAKENEFEAIHNLSVEFQNEDICYGIIADDATFYKNKNVLIAIYDNKIVGYAYGIIEEKKTDSSFYKKGDKSFYLEELYVKKEFRNLKIGSQLFKKIEEYAKELNATHLELSTSTKDYHKALNFYIKMMGLNYWSSYLIKDI